VYAIFTTQVIRTSIMYMILVAHIAFHCSSIHFVRHIVITNFIKLQIKSTRSECSHIVYCAHKILWKSDKFFSIISRLWPHCNFIRSIVKPMGAKLFPRTKNLLTPPPSERVAENLNESSALAYIRVRAYFLKESIHNTRTNVRGDFSTSKQENMSGNG